MKYFDDIKIGDVLMTGRHVFTADGIKSFAQRFDPQLFHVDEEEAARSHFGALCASGWHTAAAWMRLFVDYRRNEADAMRARGEEVAASGPALGFRDLKWMKPVYAGDVIDYKSEVIALRASNSRPGFGLATILTVGVNQNGAPVVSFASTTFIARRPQKL
ncbi:MAG: MaoC family dehydratase [Pseudolabrys sp.]|nr:MaoC family dehydratase [Pseudolabrys sp.]MDP2298230.1 MaoC family dehydratase [Pseudolabrys sp.]